MKIAISSSLSSLDSPVDLNYELADYLLVVDLNTSRFDSFLNPDYQVSDSSGIHKAELFMHYGVSSIITGGCNKKAYSVLHSTGIEIFKAKKGTVKENIDAFKNAELNPVTSQIN